MELAQAFILDVGWIFFAAWGMVLAALGAVTFGRDIFAATEPDSGANSLRIDHEGH